MSRFVDFPSLRRPSKPNHCLVAPTALTVNAKPHKEAPLFNVPPGRLFARLKKVVDDHRAWTPGAYDDAAMRVQFVAVTPLLRFKDDIDVQVLPVPGKPKRSTIAIFSRSRIGYSDLGANAKRVDALIAALQPE